MWDINVFVSENSKEIEFADAIDLSLVWVVEFTIRYQELAVHPRHHAHQGHRYTRVA